MKRFWSSVILCLALLLIGLFSFLPKTEAVDNVLPGLLNMPAPPPPNPFFTPAHSERGEDFYNKEKPPAEDAPIEDLLDYWSSQSNSYRELGYNPKPSPKTLDRISREIDKTPEKLPSFLNVLDESEETGDFVKRLYDDELGAKKFEKDWRDTVRRWLTYHTKHFSSELVGGAESATDSGEYVTNQTELLALAQVDWEKARPIVERLYNDSSKPVSQVLARWAFYKHGLVTNSFGDIDRYRDELKQIVEDKKATAGMRDLALDALVKEPEWIGRDDWYLSLLEDETLAELRVNGQVYTGLTTIIYYTPSDRFLDKMIELVKSPNPTVRNAAVRNISLLLDRSKNPELIRALLPWLENPKWAKESNGERNKILYTLQTLTLPESVPGLIAMLNEGEKRVVSYTSSTANVAVNRPAANVASSQTIVEYPFRSAAILALEKQKSPLAAGPLRQLLMQVETYERPAVVRALLASNGYSITEQVDALEESIRNSNQSQPVVTTSDATIANVGTKETAQYDEQVAPVLSANANINQNSPAYLRYLLATQLVSIPDPSEALVKAAIDRIGFLDKTAPPVANGLRAVVQNWKGAAINALLLQDLKAGKTTTAAIIKLLILRKELREKQLNEVTDIRGGSQTALGISACLLEEPADYDALLDGGSDEAKTALLACARMIRAPLPVQKVAANLKGTDKLLALAAERYLESEDSPEARRIVLAQHPNEAKILGARTSFVPDDSQSSSVFFPWIQELFASTNESFKGVQPYFFLTYAGENETTEKRLQKEVKENQELFGVYHYNNNFVRIYKDRVIFSWQDDPARYRERALSAEEFEMLKNFLVAQRVDELPPFLSACDSCEAKELLMLGRAGGRRVFVKADPLPPFFAELENIFGEFRRQPAEIHYYLEKDVPGLEVLYADDNYSAETLWKDGDDFRLLIDDLTLRRENEKKYEEVETEAAETEETEPDETESKTPPTEENRDGENTEAEDKEARLKAEQLARQKEYGSYAWFKFEKSKPLAPSVQPPSIEFLPLYDGFAVQPNEEQWKARAGGVEIRADQDGLFKVSRGQMTKLRSGAYYKPFVTPNGRWAIVSKYSEDEEYAVQTVRFNLVTNKENRIGLPDESPAAAEGVAFLPALNKVLLFSSYGEGEGDGEDYDPGERDGEFFLLDPETGAVQPFKGEARPLLQQTFRALQPVTGSPELFWAALPDRGESNLTQFGLYNLKTLTFKPLLKIPQIAFNSMDMWVDEKENRIYFVYEGQLLALPLPKRS